MDIYILDIHDHKESWAIQYPPPHPIIPIPASPTSVDGFIFPVAEAPSSRLHAAPDLWKILTN